MREIIFSIFTPLYLLITVLIAGKKKVNYSHIRHTISELAEHSSPIAKAVNRVIFFPVTVLILFTIPLDLQSLFSGTILLPLSIAIGYGGSALFPCDTGAPLRGSLNNTIHMICGTIMYGGSATALLLLGNELIYSTNLLRIIAVITALSLPLLALPLPFRGVVQRGVEILLFGVVISIHLV